MAYAQILFLAVALPVTLAQTSEEPASKEFELHFEIKLNSKSFSGNIFLVTSENTFVTGIERFGTDLECRTSTCLSSNNDEQVFCFLLNGIFILIVDLDFFVQIDWWFEDQQVTTGLRSLIGEKKAHIRHNVFFNHSRGSILFLKENEFHTDFFNFYRLLWHVQR